MAWQGWQDRYQNRTDAAVAAWWHTRSDEPDRSARWHESAAAEWAARGWVDYDRSVPAVAVTERDTTPWPQSGSNIDAAGAQQDLSLVAPPSYGGAGVGQGTLPGPASTQASGSEGTQASGSAVADPASTSPFTLDFFKTHPLRAHGCIRDHNSALKYLREQQEPPNTDFSPGNFELFPDLPLPANGNVPVYKVVHGEKEAFGFDLSDAGRTVYNWHTLVAHLDNESLEYAVNGPEGRSGGILECRFAVRPGSYDHKRQVQAPGKTCRLPVWDFVLVRADQTQLRLHPNWQGTKVPCLESSLPIPETQLPRAGLGRSDGRGTFQGMLRQQQNKTLRFKQRL